MGELLRQIETCLFLGGDRVQGSGLKELRRETEIRTASIRSKDVVWEEAIHVGRVEREEASRLRTHFILFPSL